MDLDMKTALNFSFTKQLGSEYRLCRPNMLVINNTQDNK